MSDLARLIAAAMPTESHLHTGADPCWTPDREAQRRADCSECGGAADAPNGRVLPHAGAADPIRPSELVVVVCGGCQRTRYDGTGAMARAIKPESGMVRDGWPETTALDVDGRTAAALADRPADDPTPRYQRPQEIVGL